jgi:hypothetical protein
LSQDAEKYVAFMLRSFTSEYKSKAITEIFKQQGEAEVTLSYDYVELHERDEKKESWKLLLVSSLFPHFLVSIYVYVCLS